MHTPKQGPAQQSDAPTTRQLADEIAWRVTQGWTAKRAIATISKREKKTPASLHRAFHRQHPSDGRHRNNKLSADQDNLLLWTAQAYSINNIPLDAKQIVALVREEWGVEIGTKWVGRWVKRHRSELSMRSCRALASRRNNLQILDNVDTFCEELTSFLRVHHFSERTVFNYDETRVVNQGDKTALQRIHANNNTRANIVSDRGSTLASILTFVCADGSVAMSVYVLPGSFNDSDLGVGNFCLFPTRYPTRGCWPSFFCWTDSGHVNDNAFGQIMDKFVDVWTTHNPGLHVLLFGDQLRAHRQPPVVRRCLQRGVFLFSLPANTSHFAQPLDDAPFGVFKKRFAALSHDILLKNIISHQPTRGALLEAAYESERLSLTPRTIRAGFRNTCLWPFDPKRFKALAERHLGVDNEQDLPAQMRAIATTVIRHALDNGASSESPTSGKVKVVKNAVHSPDGILELDHQQRQQRAAAEDQKAAARAKRQQAKEEKVQEQEAKRQKRESRLCRGAGCGKQHRGGKGWFGCRCAQFFLCKACRQKSWVGPLLLAHKACVCVLELA